MSLYLTVLGCSSATPTKMRHPSAFLLRSDRTKELMLIDCGEGTQIQLRRYNICMQKIAHVFISHLHGDHFLGLPGFILSQNLLGRKNPLHIYAHRPLKKIIQQLLETDKTQLQYELIFHPLKAGKNILLENNNIVVNSIPLKHSIKTHGFRFEEKGSPYLIKKEFFATHQLSVDWIERIKMGEDYCDEQQNIFPNKEIVYKNKKLKSFAYCSDTVYCPSIVKQIKKVDLLYHETTFMGDKEQVAKDKFHSTTIQAAQIAKAACVKKLLIGHYSARYKDISLLQEEAKTVFPETYSAIEGNTIEI